MTSIDYLAGAAAERNICEKIAFNRELEYGREIRDLCDRFNNKIDDLYRKIDVLEREIVVRDELLAGAGVSPPSRAESLPPPISAVRNATAEQVTQPVRESRPSYEVLEPSSGRPILAILIIAGLLAWGTVAGIQKLSANGFFAKPLPVSIPGEVGKFLKPSTITLESYGCMECHSKGGPAKSFAGLRDEMDSKKTFDQKRAVYHRLYKAVDSKPIAHRFQLTRAEKDVLVDLTLRTPRGGW